MNYELKENETCYLPHNSGENHSWLQLMIKNVLDNAVIASGTLYMRKSFTAGDRFVKPPG